MCFFAVGEEQEEGRRVELAQAGDGGTKSGLHYCILCWTAQLDTEVLILALLLLWVLGNLGLDCGISEHLSAITISPY